MRADDFGGSSIGARFYPLLYLLTRVEGARDWGTGLALNAHMLGKGSKLHVHHIFPKAQLYKRGHERGEVNAVANFCFLTAETNQAIGARPPEDYMVEIEKNRPGALASQWIPTDPALWQIDRYGDFLISRRELLAKAANAFLDALWAGIASTAAPDQAAPAATVIPADTVALEAEEADELRPLMEWLAANGIPAPALNYEIASAETGSPIAVADAAWPGGVQVGLTEPVALLLDGKQEQMDALSAAGFRPFSDEARLRGHLEAHARVPTNLVAA